ncbi:MAG: NAD(P)/FAD-dependent oxidoreductase [Candidatus Hydrothermarchaeales archaeon]
MRIGVVGAGLGGLLSAVSLVKKGHEVIIFEKLPYSGGRFTNIKYQGFALSTGALHMIPHGSNGPLASMLKNLGIAVKIIPSDPPGVFRIDGKDYRHNEIPRLFSMRDKIRITKLIADLKFGSGGNETFRQWLHERINNELVYAISDSFCGWTLSVSLDEISSREVISITRNITKLGAAGIPQGGCKGVTRALVKEFKRLNGQILYKKPVNAISIEDGRVKGLSTQEDNYEFDVIISDIGPKKTIELCGEVNFDRSYVKAVSNAREVGGIKISIACDKPMLKHTGVLFTPTRRINGANEVTNADPSLAPKGKHLLMTHQKLESNNIKKEIKLGIEELHEIFPDFDKHCKILMVQSYRDGWPVNRTPSGKHLSPESPIDGLYYVGDAIKPEGWMETEGVAKGVELMLSRLKAK